MKKNSRIYIGIIFVFLTWFNSIAAASTLASDWVRVSQIRPVIDGNVYFKVDKISMCNTDWLLLKVTDIGSQAAYSALLAATISGKEIKLETWGECAAGSGWGTEIQAINVRVQ